MRLRVTGPFIFSVVASVLFLCLGHQVSAHDDGHGVGILVYGSTELVPPDGADDQDAAGRVRLFQIGERQAIHIHVRNLEPGATYSVTASREVTSDGGTETETEDLGAITTRDGTPSPPRCFRSVLSAPDGDGDAGDGEGAWFRWRRPDGEPHGIALFYRNREGTALHYALWVRGANVTGASIDFGNGEPLALELDAENRGTVEITAEQLDALASGEATLSVQVEEGDDLSGSIEVCFSFLDEFRRRMAERLAGRGALRLSTRRGDEMPFGVESLAELVGVTISVSDAEANVVLSGVIEEVREIRRGDDGNGDNGGDPANGGDNPEDEALAIMAEDDIFQVEEPHDASFVRGDVNDDGVVDISDPISLLVHLFADAPAPYCEDAADADDNGNLEISDPIVILGVLFRGGTPRGPYPVRGFDRTVDALFCDRLDS